MLDEAEFEIGDITLICGENNTGKTYATYSLYGYLDFMRLAREGLFIRRRKLFDTDKLEEENIKNKRERKLTYVDIKDKLENHISNKTRLYRDRILVKILAGKNEDFENADFKATIQISLESVKKSIKQYLEDLNLSQKRRIKVKHIVYDDGIGFFDLNSLPEKTVPQLKIALEKAICGIPYYEYGWDFKE